MLVRITCISPSGSIIAAGYGEVPYPWSSDTIAIRQIQTLSTLTQDSVAVMQGAAGFQREEYDSRETESLNSWRIMARVRV